MSQAATATVSDFDEESGINEGQLQDLEEGGDDEEQQDDNSEQKGSGIWYRVGTGVFTVVTAGASVATLVYATTPLVYAAGVSGTVIAPYTLYQQEGVRQVQELAQTEEVFKKEVDSLAVENERLQEKIKLLSATVARLDGVGDALEALNKVEGNSMKDMRKEVAKNEEILKDMRLSLNRSMGRNLLSVLVRSDADHDGNISLEEIDVLIYRIQRVNGLEINMDKFREVIVNSGGGLKSIMNIVKKMLADGRTNEIFGCN